MTTRLKATSSRGLRYEGQVGEGVLDLLAVVEARGADDPVGYPETGELLLEAEGLGVRAVEDGHVAPSAPGLYPLLADPDAEGDFRVLVVEEAELGLRAALALGYEGLPEPARVVGHHVARHVEYALEGSVIPLELDDLGAGEDLGEAEDVAHLGAAEAVDGLVVVAYDAEIGARARFGAGRGRGQSRGPGHFRAPGEEAQELELGDVGVLVLVDEDDAEALARAPPHGLVRRAGAARGA